MKWLWEEPGVQAASIGDNEVEYRRLILFHKDNDVTIEQAKQVMERDPVIQAVIRDQSSIVVRDGPVSVVILYDGEPYVQDESEEIAELFAIGRSDKERIASCDRRFLVICDPYPDEDYFNTLILIESNLEQLVNGITFDPMSGQFT